VVGKILDNTSSDTFGFNAQTESMSTCSGRHRRSGQGRPHGPAGRSFGGRPADHHRSHGRRAAEEGSAPAMPGGGGMGGMGGMDF
jgi:chaperonin GroEL